MKRFIFLLVVFAMISFLTIGQPVAEEMAAMRPAAGRVISVVPEGKATTIATPVRVDVATILNQDTKIRIKGKPASLKDVNEGDAVTIYYLKPDDFYAKEVAKRRQDSVSYNGTEVSSELRTRPLSRVFRYLRQSNA